jgi:uncharacterized membrane protein (UPF0127 family)
MIVIIAHPMGDLRNHASTVEFKGDNNTAVIVQVEVADTDSEQEYGLMNRTSMAPYHGMLFVFNDEETRSFWMKDTLISLDMVFLDSSGLIVDINKNATPLSEIVFTAKSPSKYVVEVNGGFCDLHGIRVGDNTTISLV